MTLDVATPGIRLAPEPPFSVEDAQRVFVTVDFSQVPAGRTTRRIRVASDDPDESPYPGGVHLVINGGGCLHDVDFESGAGGWSRGADTCTSGSFIVGRPDATPSRWRKARR